MTTYTVAVGEIVTGTVLGILDTQNVYGRANNTTISNTSDQYVWSGGTASNTIIHLGGRQYVYGTADNTIGEGFQYIYSGGTATNTTAKSLLQYVESGGTAKYTTITDLGIQTVYSGGTAINTTIDYGFQNVDSGAIANNTTINGSALRAGTQFLYGTATNTTISGYGQQVVEDRATATNTSISKGGKQTVFGEAFDTTISDGLQWVSGIATKTIILNNGLQELYGTATNTIISDGGEQHVNFTGTAHNTTIDGGLMDLSGKATGTITFGDGGTLLIRQFVSGNISFASPLVNVGVGVAIDVRDLSFDPGHAPVLSGSHHLTVSDGHFSSLQFTLITPQATHFMVSDDGFGGTILIACAAVSIVSLSASKAEGSIGTTAFTFTVSLDQADVTSRTVSWAVTGTGANPASASDFAGGELPSGTVTFAPGETSKIVTLLVLADASAEPDEDFTVTLSNPSPDLAIGTASASGSITSDDASVSLAALAAARTEGNSDTTAFTFTAIRIGDTSGTDSVSYGILGSGANPADASDFAGGTLPAGIVTFATGETSKTITLGVAGDAFVEADETFEVILSVPSAGLTLGSASAGGVIQNDDSSVVSIAALSAAKAEGDTGTTAFTFAVSLDQAGVASQTVSWAVTGSGANPADAFDFAAGVLPSGMVTFAAGEITKTVTVAVSGDAAVEFDEAFTVTLSNASPGVTLGTPVASGTIVNDDTSIVSIAALSASGPEGGGNNTFYTFSITLDRPSVLPQTVDWAVAGAGAHPADGPDFGGLLPSGSVSFAAGETTQVLSIAASGDTAVELDEGFTVSLSSPSPGLGIGTASATGTIQNDDAAVSITALAAVKAEGNSGTTPFTFTVTVTGDTSTARSVAWAASGSGASPPVAADFAGGVVPSGTVTFAPGETSKTITVNVAGDMVAEADEDFCVTLSSPSPNLGVGTSSATGTIQNDDAAVSITALAAVKAEGNSGTTPFTFTINLYDLAGVTSQSVNWAVAGSGATPADALDFAGGVLPTGTATFAAGETIKAITVNVTGDAIVEPNEDFTVTLSNPSSGLTIINATATRTILNDDGVLIAATDSAKNEGSIGVTAFVFAVTQSGDPSVSGSVSWAVSGSGAVPASASDFEAGVLPFGVVTFSTGETSKIITVNVVGDTIVEPTEEFTVTLSNPSLGLVLGSASATTFIRNDDIVYADAYVVVQSRILTAAAEIGVLRNDLHFPNINGVMATVATGPEHGSLQLAADGGFTYIAASNFTGIDSFEYHAATTQINPNFANLGLTGNAQATIYIVPVNVGSASTTLNLLALTTQEQIAAIYAAFFGRGADAAGFDFWVNQFVTGLPVQGPAMLFANIASSFGISEEAKALYPFLANPFGASDTQISAFLDSVYNNLFNRGSDPAGLAYWTGQVKQALQAGQFVGSILVNIIGGAQDSAAGLDITALMGKVAVSLDYVQEQQSHGTVWAGAADVAAATSLLEAVTADPLSVLVGIRTAEDLIAAHA